MFPEYDPPIHNLPQSHDAKTRWGQERRLAFIDFRLQFEGKLNRGDLSQFFGISIPQASQDLARYAALAPENLRYDTRGKVFVRGESFCPRYGSNDAGAYLKDILALENGIIRPDTSFIGSVPPYGIVPTLKRPMAAMLLATVLAAIRERHPIQINYQSISNEHPTSRIISPHALGHDGFRWHIRAFCHRRKAFTDFVFGRILDIKLSDLAWVDAENDLAWHRHVTLELAPNPKLSSAQQAGIALDYGMDDGHLRVESRQALLFYTLRRLGLNRKGDAEGSEQHIVLTNKDEVAPYLQVDVNI